MSCLIAAAADCTLRSLAVAELDHSIVDAG